MAITMNGISTGQALLLDGEIYQVIEHQHVKPGKGGAFVRVKFRHVKTENTLERTFKAGDKLEEAPLEEVELEFLYHSEGQYHFMDHTSFEQMALSEEVLGDGAKFLLENLTVTGLVYQDRVLKVMLPTFIVTELVESEPGIRGDSSKSGNKPAKIKTGATVMVPLFINQGDVIKIDTRSGQYVERIQK